MKYLALRLLILFVLLFVLVKRVEELKASEAELDYLRKVSASLDYARERALEDKASWQRSFSYTSETLVECLNELEKGKP